jgi:23S rRNA-/tRNA-specific pseudouridylate synthase
MEAFRVKVKEEGKLIDVVSTVTESKRRAKKLIDEGLVCIDGRKELFYRRRVKEGSLVEFCLNYQTFSPVKIEILLERNGILIINKPPFVNSNVDKPNLEEIVSKRLNRRIKVVHRLDKQTSGLILATNSKELFKWFKELFRRKAVKKEYLALVVGNPKDRSKISIPLDGREAVTEVTVIERLRGGALCKVSIPTGRKHQIRRHLSMSGFPVAGEFRYWKNYRSPFTFTPRILLHSFRITFPLPDSKKTVTVESRVPEDFLWFTEGLKKGFRVREVEFPPTSQGIWKGQY